MIETLAQWFVDGGWGSFGVMAWVPFGLLFALVGLVAAIAQWRSAPVFGAASLVLAFCMLGAAALGVYSGYAKHEIGLAGGVLGQTMKERALRMAYEEVKGCAKLALVFSLPSLLVGALALYRGRRPSIEGTSLRKHKLQRVFSKAILASAGLAYFGNIGIVLAKGPGEELEPKIFDLHDEADSLRPIEGSNVSDNDLRGYYCHLFEKRYEQFRSEGLDLESYPRLSSAIELCREMAVQMESQPELFSTPEARAELWERLDREREITFQLFNR